MGNKAGRKLPTAVIMFVMVFLLLLSGCTDTNKEAQTDYEKCTQVCSSVLEDDYITMQLCMEECQAKFLGSEGEKS